MRAGDVERAQAVAQVQRLRDDAGVLPVLERQAGRCQVDTLDTVPPGATERVAGRFDGHGDRILVPVGDGPLALAQTCETVSEPGVRVGHDPALQTQPRHVTAKGVDSDRHPQCLGRAQDTMSTRPLSRTMTFRSSARERNETRSPSRQISVRIVSPGKTGAEKRRVIVLNRAAS